MFNRLAITLLLATLSTANVHADQASATSRTVLKDPRIRSLTYSDGNVYRLDVPLKAVSAVEFADGEEVESILIGDSASWEVVKLKNGRVVSIKPIIASATTNMTVYTDRRVYTFELHSLSETAGHSPPIRSVFAYPEDRKKVTPATVVRPERINTGYLVSGKAEFRPLWIQDNGRQTSFFLPEDSPRPAIFKVGPKKEEQLINSRTQGSRVIVDGVSDFWVLRIGDKSVCIGQREAVGGR